MSPYLIYRKCYTNTNTRCNVDCANILTNDGCLLRWVAELRYLGVYIARSCTFRCSLNYAKRSFFGAVNGLFGKLLNPASETVILELVRSKCMPILCYILPMLFIYFLWPPYSPALVNGSSRKFYTWWTLSVINGKKLNSLKRCVRTTVINLQN